MAALVEASQRSDVIQDIAVPDGRPIPVPPPFMAAQVIPPGSRVRVLIMEKLISHDVHLLLTCYMECAGLSERVALRE